MTARLLVLDLERLKQKASITNSRSLANRKLRVLIKDSFKCVQCGTTENLTIDHIIKSNKGRGASAYKPQECQTLCEECHLEKNRSAWTWIKNV